MAICRMCHKSVPDGVDFCDECKIKMKNQADESYLDSLLSSVSGNSAKTAKRKTKPVTKNTEKSSVSSSEINNSIPVEVSNSENISSIENIVNENSPAAIDNPIDPVEETIDVVNAAIGNISDVPADSTIDNIPGSSIEVPIDDPVIDPIDVTAGGTMDISVESPVDDLIDNSVEPPVDDMLDDSVESPIGDMTDNYVEPSIGDTITETSLDAAEVVNSSFDDPDINLTNQSFNDPLSGITGESDSNAESGEIGNAGIIDNANAIFDVPDNSTDSTLLDNTEDYDLLSGLLGTENSPAASEDVSLDDLLSSLSEGMPSDDPSSEKALSDEDAINLDNLDMFFTDINSNTGAASNLDESRESLDIPDDSGLDSVTDHQGISDIPENDFPDIADIPDNDFPDMADIPGNDFSDISDIPESDFPDLSELQGAEDNSGIDDNLDLDAAANISDDNLINVFTGETGDIDIPESADIPDGIDISDTNDILAGIDMPESTDISEVTDITGSTDIPDGIDIADNADILAGIDIPESTDISEVTDITGSTDIPDGIDITDNADILAGIDIPESTDISEVTDITGSADMPDGIDIPEIADMPEGMDIPGSADMPEGMDIPAAVDISEGMDIPESTEMPEGIEIPENTEISDDINMSGDMSISESVDIPESNEVSESFDTADETGSPIDTGDSVDSEAAMNESESISEDIDLASDETDKPEIDYDSNEDMDELLSSLLADIDEAKKDEAPAEEPIGAEDIEGLFDQAQENFDTDSEIRNSIDSESGPEDTNEELNSIENEADLSALPEETGGIEEGTSAEQIDDLLNNLDGIDIPDPGGSQDDLTGDLSGGDLEIPEGLDLDTGGEPQSDLDIDNILDESGLDLRPEDLDIDLGSLPTDDNSQEGDISSGSDVIDIGTDSDIDSLFSELPDDGGSGDYRTEADLENLINSQNDDGNGLITEIDTDAFEEKIKDLDSGEAQEKDKKKKKKSWFQRLFGNIKEDLTPEQIQARKDKEKAEEEAKIKAAEAKKKKEELTKEQKEKKKAEAKAAAAEAAKKKAEEKKRKAAEAKEKARKKKEERLAIEEFEADEGKINKAGATVLFVIFAAMTIFIIVGTNIYSYNLSIKNAQEDFDEKLYNEAYYEVYGLKVKDEHIELYDKIMTVQYVNSELNSYKYYMYANNREKALDALLKGLQRYDKYFELAMRLGIRDDLAYVKSQILEKLSTEFQLTEDDAYDMLAIRDDIDYSEYLYSLIGTYDLEITP